MGLPSTGPFAWEETGKPAKSTENSTKAETNMRFLLLKAQVFLILKLSFVLFVLSQYALDFIEGIHKNFNTLGVKFRSRTV